jgi:hypothetical protein
MIATRTSSYYRASDPGGGFNVQARRDAPAAQETCGLPQRWDLQEQAVKEHSLGDRLIEVSDNTRYGRTV